MRNNLSLYLSIFCFTTSLSTGGAYSSSLAINDFNTDQIIFDVGAAFGRNTASVSVGGVAKPGQSIDVRIATEDGGVASSWINLGHADALGRWSGTVKVDADENWYHVEARDSQSQLETVRTKNRIAGGDVVAFMGQSSIKRISHSFFDRSGPVHVPSEDQVQWVNNNGISKFIGNSIDDKSTSAMKALANFWIENAPAGRKVQFVDLAQSGTSRADLFDDSRPKRRYSEFENTVQSVRQNGTDIGLVIENWYGSDRNIGGKWSEAFTGFYTGKNTDGSTFERGALTIQGASVDHFLWDLSGGGRGLFEKDVTKLGNAGPHRFDSAGSERLSATVNIDGSVIHGLRAIERSRAGVNDFFSSSLMKELSVETMLPVPLDYATGYIDENGQWKDLAHPSGVSTDGLQRFAKHMGNAALLALGHLNYEVPRFDLVRWTEDYVEVGSTTGKITTARIERGLDSLDKTFSHWTDVFGFEIDGVGVKRAEIAENGFVKIYPLDGQSFTRDTILSYGMGGANGFLNPFEDYKAGAFLNLPIVNVGLIGLEGVAVLPTAGTYDIPNNLGLVPAPIPAPIPLLLLPAAIGFLKLTSCVLKRSPRRNPDA